MLGYYAQGKIYGGTVLLGGGLRSPSAFLVSIFYCPIYFFHINDFLCFVFLSHSPLNILAK